MYVCTGKVRAIFSYELKPPRFSGFCFILYIVANNYDSLNLRIIH